MLELSLCFRAGQAAAFGRLASLMASAASSAVDGLCLMPEEHWDVGTAMVAGALASAAHWASWQRDSRSEPADGSGGRGTSGGTSQQPQQECMQQAAFVLSPAARQLLLRAAAAGLDGLERGWTDFLLSGLAGHCRVDPAALERHVRHHVLVRARARSVMAQFACAIQA
jgi:hypothetical protein